MLRSKYYVAFLVLLSSVVMGCATFQGMFEGMFGAAETSAQRGYRMLYVYNYLAIPITVYMQMDGADVDAVKRACQVDRATYTALQEAVVALGAESDGATVALQLASAALMSWGLEVLGTDTVLDSDEDEMPSTVYLAALGTSKLAQMRLYRSTAKASMNALVASGEDPTLEQWEGLQASTLIQHEVIQAVCRE